MEMGQIATTLLFENEYVRVWNLLLEPGEATDWHQHELDYLYIVIEPGKVQTEYIDGTCEKQDDTPGTVVMRRIDKAHRLVNTGTSSYSNVVIELKGKS